MAMLEALEEFNGTGLNAFINERWVGVLRAAPTGPLSDSAGSWSCMIDYALMNQYLYEGKAKEVEQMTKDALAEGRRVQEVLNEGLIAGMSVVGEDFKHNILYVPEVLIAARAMKAGMAVLKPLLSCQGRQVRSRRRPADGHRPRRSA